MKTFRLYIGSNNETGELEDKKAERVVAKRFEGFTTIKRGVTGHWKGSKENTMVVEIATDEEDELKKTVEELKEELKQEAVGVTTIGEMQFI